MAGNGTTQLPQSYSYLDHEPVPGINYYRLTQQDFNGEVSTPWMAAASIEAEAFSVRVYPNPIKPKHATWFLQLSGTTKDIAHIAMHNSSGEIVMQESIQANASQMTLELEKPQGCTAGVYFLKVSYSGRTITRKIIFQ